MFNLKKKTIKSINSGNLGYLNKPKPTNHTNFIERKNKKKKNYKPSQH